VVADGVTCADPLNPEHAAQFEIVTLVACCESHVSVALCPAVTVAGSAVSETPSCPASATVIVTLAVCVPPGPVAVAVYVVVALGVTLCVPLGTATLPTPWSIVIDVACSLDQLSVALSPGRIDVRSAVSVTVGATWFTVMVMLARVLPAEFVAVKVYVVVLAGDTVTEPLSGNVSAPSISIAGLTLTLVAFALDQLSVASSPAEMVVRSALAVMLGGVPCCGSGDGGVLALPPAQPVAASATSMKMKKEEPRRNSLGQRFADFTFAPGVLQGD
jgi:hypothetical protein